MQPTFVQESVSLAKYVSNRTGGIARFFAEPSSEDELKELFAWILAEQLPYFVLGGGSNTLVSDRGFNGVVIRLNFKAFSIQGTTVMAQAGVQWPLVGLKTAKAGLTGLEHASVVPGTVGGAIYGNAGAYDQETKDFLTSVRLFNVETHQFEVLEQNELLFGYRHSVFKEHPEWVIVSATFELQKGNQEEIDARLKEYREHRESTQPLSQPSSGCVFKNPPNHYAGKLIEEAGLKGYRVGDVMVSDVHANFLVNRGNATAEDMQEVRAHVKETVLRAFGVQLEEENILLEPRDDS